MLFFNKFYKKEKLFTIFYFNFLPKELFHCTYKKKENNFLLNINYFK